MTEKRGAVLYNRPNRLLFLLNLMIFRRTFVSELANSAGGVFTVLFSIVLTVGLVQILSDAVGGDVGSTTVFELVAYSSLVNMPPLLTVSIFIAVLMVMMRSWQDSEMIVWFSTGGRSLLSWIRPVLQFALPLIILVGVLSTALTPWAKAQIERTTETFQQRDDVNRVSPGRFIETAGGNRVFFIEDADNEGTHIKNIFLSERTRDGKEIVVQSDAGEIVKTDEGDRYIALTDGRRYEAGGTKSAAWRVVDFVRYDLLLQVRADAAIAKLGVDEIPLQTLFALNTRAAKGEILWRFSWPLAAFNLVLLAIPLSYTNPRAGRSLSLVIAVLIFVLYLNGISIGQTWVRGGKMEWYTGVILINGSVFLITAMLFIRRVWMTRWLPLAWTEWPYRLREARKERAK